MTRLFKNNQGEIIDIDDPESQKVNWDLKDYKKAQNLLELRFDDAPCSAATVQEMVSVLIEKFRNDPEQIDRAIVQHFTKRNFKKVSSNRK
jgi:hypothetical protein